MSQDGPVTCVILHCPPVVVQAQISILYAAAVNGHTRNERKKRWIAAGAPVTTGDQLRTPVAQQVGEQPQCGAVCIGKIRNSRADRSARKRCCCLQNRARRRAGRRFAARDSNVRGRERESDVNPQPIAAVGRNQQFRSPRWRFQQQSRRAEVKVSLM